jgi:MFS family permease
MNAALTVTLALLKALLLTVLLATVSVFLLLLVAQLGLRTALGNSEVFGWTIVSTPFVIAAAGIVFMGFLATHFDPQRRMFVGILGGIVIGAISLAMLDSIDFLTWRLAWINMAALLVAALLATFGAWIRHYRKRFEGI